MTRFGMIILVLAGLALVGCSASPDNPVNQTPPIRAMDHFFRTLSAPAPQPVPDYEHEPGYAPAYPPYQP
ncbi:MAG: hypothetical protein B7Z80_04155 [Rhodospirillales bacterium 20-64-7]|nr:MAG: hypothetical protein B7Z80_04155 [Rhodospirillales bacterium 20-64-7]